MQLEIRFAFVQTLISSSIVMALHSGSMAVKIGKINLGRHEDWIQARGE